MKIHFQLEIFRKNKSFYKKGIALFVPQVYNYKCGTDNKYLGHNTTRIRKRGKNEKLDRNSKEDNSTGYRVDGKEICNPETDIYKSTDWKKNAIKYSRP